MPRMGNERELLKQVYPNKCWADKVDRLSDAEVVELYSRIQKQIAKSRRRYESNAD